MALGSPKVSIFVAGFPRKVSTIAVAIGGLASFFVCGFLLRVSYPVGSSVGGIFYGIGTPEQVDFPLSLSNHTVKVLHNTSNINTTDKNLASDFTSSSSPDVSTKIPQPDFDSERKLEAPLSQEKEDKVSLDTAEKTDVGSGEIETNVPKAGDTPSASSPLHVDSETASPETGSSLLNTLISIHL